MVQWYSGTVVQWYSAPTDNVSEGHDQGEQQQQEEEEQQQDSCPICLGDDPANWTTTRCGHGFHQNCLGVWLERRHTCPLCRGPLDPVLFMIDWVIP